MEMPSAATVRFVRQARRIRLVGRSDVTQTHAALHKLIAVRNGGQAKSTGCREWSDSAVLKHGPGAAHGFADLVAANLVGPVLPWTARRTLLRQATLRGIGRFEANLIIAAVQHRVAGKSRSRRPQPFQSRQSFSPLAMLGTFLLVQSVIVGVFWHLWH
jgi:hypothetical protein